MNIDIEKVIDFIRDNAPAYGEAKGQRVGLEEFRKSLKAQLMQKAEAKGFTSAASQEREAYAHPDYIEFIKGLAPAIEREETLRWMLEAARIKAGIFQTLEANKRIEAKTII